MPGRAGSRRLVAQRGRDGALLLHVLGGQAVDFVGGDARLDVRREVVQHFGGQAARRRACPGCLSSSLYVMLMPELSQRGPASPGCAVARIAGPLHGPSQRPAQAHRVVPPTGSTRDPAHHRVRGRQRPQRLPRPATAAPPAGGRTTGSTGCRRASCTWWPRDQPPDAGRRRAAGRAADLRRAVHGAADGRADRRHAAAGHRVALGVQGHRHRAQLRPGRPAHRARHANTASR